MKTKFKIRRLLLIVSLFFILSGVTTVDLEDYFINKKQEESIVLVAHTVVAGETIWSISDVYMNRSIDKRQVVKTIRDYNEIKDSKIYPGDVIYIPTLSSSV